MARNDNDRKYCVLRSCHRIFGFQYILPQKQVNEWILVKTVNSVRCSIAIELGDNCVAVTQNFRP